MNRDITTDRLYSLGQFQNIRFSDTLKDLPEEICLNSELVGELRYLQMIEIELNFRKYLKLTEALGHYKMEDAIGYLEETKTNLIDELKPLLTNTKGE